jgi:glycerol-3-phosphate dehydrogenase (NAD(P)+)
MTVTIAGAGAFGTALAIALAQGGRQVTLLARDSAAILSRGESPRLPGFPLPPGVAVCPDDQPVTGAVLLAVPAQALRQFLADRQGTLGPGPFVACAKGVDLTTLQGPTAAITAARPAATSAVLTGPSFAVDIAAGLPTALTLACADPDAGAVLQRLLSTPALRIYRTTDVIGAELGGALKNVMAIACGAAIGAGFGDSARAALVTRGFAEMRRLARTLGARDETLAGLSGFGDLVLTCTSPQSRNFAFGLSLGQGTPFPPGITVEGAATARALSRLAQDRGLDLPITAVVAALADQNLTVTDALHTLLNRPLKEE